MESDLAPQQARRRVHRRPLRPRENALVFLEGLVSIGGLAGGIYMMTDPLSVMDLRYLDGTWFHTWRWPGLLLFLLVGVGPVLVIVATLIRLPLAGVAHACVGAGLLAWILVQTTWVVIAPVLQVTVALIGFIILLLGIREIRDRAQGADA